MKFKSCYECPKYHHKGAFGSPRYKPMCGKKVLPYDVDNNNHASPMKSIKCVNLE